MNDLPALLWIETRKALRASISRWMLLMALMLPLSMAFLIFVSKNPAISRRLGLISAKADLMAYAAADWSAYLGLFGQLIAAGGFMFFVFIISWVFGREFADGTLKDLLAVPTPRGGIVLAKYLVTAVWSLLITGEIFIAGAGLGALLRLPGAAGPALQAGGVRIAITAGLTLAAVTPFALLASIGRGYLLPLGAAVLTLMMANLAAVVGRGVYFPWAIPGLYAQAESPLPPVSYGILLATTLLGCLGTHLWWKYADQNR